MSCLLSLPKMLVCVSALLLAFGCSGPRVRAVSRAGILAIDGSVGIETAGTLAAGVELDASKLGLDDDDDDVVFQPRLDLGFGFLDVTLENLEASYSGTGVAQAQFSLLPGQTISAAANVRSELDAVFSRGQAIFDFIPGETIDVGIGVGVGFIDYDLAVTSLDTGVTVGTDDDIVFPFLAGRVAARIWRFEPEIYVGGGAIELDEEEIMYLDVDASLGFEFFDIGDIFSGTLVGGYRYVDVDYEFEDFGGSIDTNLDFQGPYLGGTVTLSF